MKIPMTPAGIEPATFRFVAQHLNRFATAVLADRYYEDNINIHNITKRSKDERNLSVVTYFPSRNIWICVLSLFV